MHFIVWGCKVANVILALEARLSQVLMLVTVPNE